MIGFIDTIFTITPNHNQSSVEHFFLACRGLAPFSFSLIWFCAVVFILSRGGSIENTSVAQQWIYVNHTENTASSIVAFTAPPHRNGSYTIVVCIFVVAGICLPRRCPTMGLHVTLRMKNWKRLGRKQSSSILRWYLKRHIMRQRKTMKKPWSAW
jgi:hypothetical protein